MLSGLLRTSIWLVLCLPGMAIGQNLVRNGSFETFRDCPHHDNQLEEAVPWYNPNKATPDFYHHCFDFGQLILPPHSGNGVAHLFFDVDWAEYLGIELTEPLTANQCYYFEMYIATNTPGKVIPETVGAYVSSQPISGTTTGMLKARPQVLDHIPRNSMGNLQWQRVSGVINADGGERYLTIGSFVTLPGFLGYYYLFVDDVSLVQIKLDLGRDSTLCSRKDTYQLDATTPGAIDYRWQDGSTKPTFLVTKPGKYAVTAVTACRTLKDSITINYALDFDLGNDTTLCNAQTLSLKVPYDSASTYRWQDGSNQTTFTVKQEGTYTIRVEKAQCVATDTIRVRFIRPPTLDLGPDTELCGAQTFTIKPTVTDGTFSWFDGFEAANRTVSASGVYWGRVKNDCATVTDSIEIDYGACDCLLYAPNSFSPNGDGQNDVFLAYGCGDITITSLAIYSRWGEVIFKTDQAPFQWDGYYRGDVCEIGVYAWHVTYRLKSRQKVKYLQEHGSLSLIR
ncbi:MULTISPECIES: gliding motility-associated C-terminal domain-containing protein [unclassified Spirosoma]|uniref:T9SS type B sorting domain-containing protein n=1 Tax=unclassified Spirosoma TaxID=2621999 RepID=UPI0009683DC2|nr:MULTISPECIES: gliding motility-associated C-terminal domain-containing protein [unclassified Spirosoma]MBN8821853.1 gliding motility-associated C-terminal domain-containing protein [Spirosoma sp.]OJW80661.1 MAG: hypothetical protein BGO59_34925 [Spirosoma sp. 48-14]